MNTNPTVRAIIALARTVESRTLTFARCATCGFCCQSKWPDVRLRILLCRAERSRHATRFGAFRRCRHLGSKGCRMSITRRPLECLAYPVVIAYRRRVPWLAVDRDCPAWQNLEQDLIDECCKAFRMAATDRGWVRRSCGFWEKGANLRWIAPL